MQIEIDSQYKMFAKSRNSSVAQYAHLKIAKHMCRKVSCYKVHIISALRTTVERFVSDQLGLLVICGWPYFFSSEI